VVLSFFRDHILLVLCFRCFRLTAILPTGLAQPLLSVIYVLRSQAKCTSRMYVRARDACRRFSIASRVFSLPLPNLSRSVSPRGAVHADLLTKHQRRVRICHKLLSSACLQSNSSIWPATSVTSCSPFPSNFRPLKPTSKCCRK